MSVVRRGGGSERPMTSLEERSNIVHGKEVNRAEGEKTNRNKKWVTELGGPKTRELASTPGNRK